HVLFWVHPEQAIQQPLDRPQHRRQKRALTLHHAGHVGPKRLGESQEEERIEDNLCPANPRHLPTSARISPGAAARRRGRLPARLSRAPPGCNPETSAWCLPTPIPLPQRDSIAARKRPRRPPRQQRRPPLPRDKEDPWVPPTFPLVRPVTGLPVRLAAVSIR